MSIFEAIILAIIEGITEFLPVSSTGHMIIASSVMGIDEHAFTKLFEVNIQLGAILSVLVLYHKRFLSTIDFYFKLLLAFIPTAVLGFLLDDYIDAMLSNVLVVAISLVLGGFVLIFIDKIFKNAKHDNLDGFPHKNGVIIGLFQSLAMIPGISRSAASIIGGQTQGLSRKAAAEFSFFLAVPTMFAASAYKLLKGYEAIQTEHITTLLVGNVVAFVVAMLAIKFFINFLTQYGFKVFGYYRIIVGLIILALYAFGYELKVD